MTSLQAKTLTPIEHWCWQSRGRPISNQELFNLARQMTGQTEMSREDLEENLEQAAADSSPPLPDEARRQLDEYAQERLSESMMPAGQPADIQDRKGSDRRDPNVGADSGGGQGGEAGDADDSQAWLQQAAQAALNEAAGLIGRERSREFGERLSQIKEIQDLFQLAEEIADQASQAVPAPRRERADDSRDLRNEEDGPGGDQKGEGPAGRLAARPFGSEAGAGDGFRRTAAAGEDGFEGLEIIDGEPGIEAVPDDGPQLPAAPGMLEKLSAAAAEYRRLKQKITSRSRPEMSPDQLRALVNQLVQQRLISPSGSDRFVVNRDRVAWLLARDAYRSLERLFKPRRLASPGAHLLGTRGLQAVLPDRVRRAQYLTSRLAVLPTLRRGLLRKIQYPYSYVLDEDDLIEYGGRNRVGFSVVIALDVSGAVQFGKRIQSIRRACLAFSYFLKRFYPYDRVHTIAYHERPRMIRLADVPRLRAVNGAGKDIGGCLEKCRETVLKDPDRVPVIILIGDGLPARGDSAGFYRFRENNREVIEKAYHQAGLLKKEKVLFAFYQFHETRHIWQEYAEECGGRIAREAGGIHYRIDRPGDVAVSLLQRYATLRQVEKNNFGSRRRDFG